MSIQRAVTDNKFFDDPDSVIYAFSAGSMGHKHVYNQSFQWVRVFDKSYSKLADVERYDFKDEELAFTKSYSLPPQIKDEKVTSVNLLETLKTEEPSSFLKYKVITDNFEQIIQDSKIDDIIQLIGDLFTIFKDIKLELRKNTTITYVLLLSINYRIIFLRNKYNSESDLLLLLVKLEHEILITLNKSKYATDLVTFLSSDNNSDIDRNYSLIMKNISSSDKRISAYCSIGLFITDLFLNISSYGEYYFEKEKLNHKINIQLTANSFYKSIPSDSI